MGQLSEATQYYEWAVAIDEPAFGHDHPHVATVVNNYGLCLMAVGQIAAAREKFEWAKGVFEKKGPDHPKLASVINNLGYSMRKLGELEGAHEQFRRALEMAEKKLSGKHPTVASILHNLGDVARGMGNLESARSYFERAMAIDKAVYGPGHPDVARDVDALVDAQAREQDPAKRKVITEDPQFDVNSTINNPKTNALEAVSYTRQRTEYEFIDPKVKADFAVLEKVRKGDIASVSQDLNDDKWIVGFVVDDAPEYWYLYDRSKRQATLLFSNRPQLEKYKLSAMKPVEFTARDGMKLYGYLTTPVGREAKNLPMVEFVHGGPWGRDEWGFNRYAQWLSNRGYAVLQINFRGSTGYGKKYVNAGDRQWAGTMHTDLLDGKDWVAKQGIVDPAKVCIMGGSYGGYATLAGVTFSPDAFACGVDIVGPSNLNTLLKSIPPYWSTFLATFHKRMGDTEAVLKEQSPLFKADQIKAPLLIGQGANDPRVNKAESDQIVAAMRKNEKPVLYYVFPDEGHGFARPANNMAFNAASEEFLAKYLGGRFEPATPDESKLLASIKQ